MKKIAKRAARWLLVIFGVLVLLFSAGFAIVYSKQEALVKTLIDDFSQDIQGKIALDRSKISLFQNFPYISIDLQGLSIFENKADSLPIVKLDDVYVGFDIFKLINGDFQIKKIKLIGGHLHMHAYSNGTYNIANAFKSLQETNTKADESNDDLWVNLKSVNLKNLTLRKTSESDSIDLTVAIAQMKSSFQKNPSDIFVKVKSDLLLSLKHKDSVWADQKSIAIDTRCAYDKAEQVVRLEPSSLKIQGVSFEFNGNADLKNDLDLNLSLQGRKNDFSLLVAFLPADLGEFMRRYDNAGNIYFDAQISGKCINGHQPAITANFGCEKGYFKNRNVNRTLDDFSFSASYTNGSERNLSSSEFRLTNLAARPEQGIVSASLLLKNFTDPYVDLKVKTDFDLQFLADFLQLSALENLKGRVVLNVDYNELVDINNTGLMMTKVKQGINSQLKIENLAFKIPDYPYPIENINAFVEMEGGQLNVKKFSMKVQNSDFDLKAQISSLPALLHGWEEKIEMKLELNSKLVDLYTLTGFDSIKIKPIAEKIQHLQLKTSFSSVAKELKSFRYLPKGDFAIEQFKGKLNYYPHKIEHFQAKLSIDEKDIQLHDFVFTSDATTILLSGAAENYPKWFKEKTEGKSRIVFNIASDQLKPADLLTYKGMNYWPDDYKNENIRYLKIKGNIDLDYINNQLKAFELNLEQAQAQLTIHPLKLRNISGRIHGENGKLTAHNLSIAMGKSDARFSMLYHYGEKKKGAENRFELKSTMLDFDELVQYEKHEKACAGNVEAHNDSFNIFKIPFSNTSIKFDVDNMRYHKLMLGKLKGRIRLKEDHQIFIDTMSMDIAGGHIDLRGRLNGSNPEAIYFSPEFKLKNVDLNQVMVKVDNFGQEYLINDNIKGHLSGTIKGKIKLYPDLFPILDRSELDMDLMFKDGVLVNYAPMRSLGTFFADRNLNYIRFDTLQNLFSLRNNEITVPRMTINSSLGFLELSGKQSLSNDMNYLVRVPVRMVTQVAANRLFGGRGKEEIPEEQIDEIVRREDQRRVRFISVRISGNSENLNVSLARNSRAS